MKRTLIPLENLIPSIEALFGELTENLRRRSKDTLNRNIREAQTLEDARRGLDERKMVEVNWCGDENCALQIKEEIGGEIRGYRFDTSEKPSGPCIVCGRTVEKVVYVVRAY